MFAHEDRKQRKLQEDHENDIYVIEEIKKTVKRRQEVKKRMTKLTDEAMRVVRQNFDELMESLMLMLSDSEKRKYKASIYRNCAGSIRMSRPTC